MIYADIDKRLPVDLRSCNRFCTHDRGQAVGLHVSCMAVVLCPWSPAFGKATRYSFKPQPCEERKRRDFVRREVADGLAHTDGRLPPEIWLMVADYLTCEYAASNMVYRWLYRRSSNCAVATSQSIWARHTTIEGAKYLTGLRNDKYDSSDECIFDIHRQRLNIVHVLEDHVGIRRLVFVDQDDARMPASGYDETGCWWRVLSAPEVLRVASDVSSPSSGK